MQPIDLRSDTVTVPTPAMRRAMYAAEVGDDQYGEDPTVRRLEEQAADLLGKPAGLFVTSGTQGNQVAAMAQTQPGDEVILEATAHMLVAESGALARLSGCQTRPLPGEQGALRPEQVAAAIRPALRPHFPRTGLVGLENTHNFAGGTVLPREWVEGVAAVAHRQGIPVHLDGARIFNAAVASGRKVADLVAPVDTVQFCLSKGLGAPVGSLLVGPDAVIQRARRFRQLLGGGLRQAGILAAAGIVALDTMIDRLAEDHENARLLAAGIAELPGLTVDMASVQTNMIFFTLTDGRWQAPVLVAALKAHGVLCNLVGPQQLRWVTHKDVTRADCQEALQRLAAVLRSGPPAGGPARPGEG